MEFILLEKRLKEDRIRLLAFFVFLLVIDIIDILGLAGTISTYRRGIFLAIIYTNRNEIILPADGENKAQDPHRLNNLIITAGRKYETVVFVVFLMAIAVGMYIPNIIIKSGVYIASYIIALMVYNLRDKQLRMVVEEYVNNK